MAQGVTRIVPTFLPSGIHSNPTRIMALPGHSNLGADGRYTCSNLSLMVWWMPYLNKHPRPDFNNGPRGDTNNGCRVFQGLFEYLNKRPRPDFNNGQGGNFNSCRILVLQHFLNDPSTGHSKLGSDGRYTCPGLPLTVSWWVPYPAKGPKPDFNKGPEDDSNSCHISSGFYSSPIRIRAPPQALPILWQMEYTSFHVSHLWFPGGFHIWPKAQAWLQ